MLNSAMPAPLSHKLRDLLMTKNLSRFESYYLGMVAIQWEAVVPLSQGFHTSVPRRTLPAPPAATPTTIIPTCTARLSWLFGG